jgi:predicted Zn-dependent peptidase
VLALIRTELAAVAEYGVSPDELARGKGMSRGGYVLGLEDTGSRMGRLAKGELFYGEQLPVDQLLARVADVDAEQVGAVAAELLTRPMSLAVVGPVESATLAG